MRYGIGFKLGLLLAIFGLVAMGTVGYYSYASNRASLLEAAQRDLLTATQVLGRNFQSRLDEVAADTLLLASLPGSRLAANAPAGLAAEPHKAQLADIFAAMLAVHPEYFQVRLIGARQHGLELVRVDRDGAQLVRVPAADLQEKAHYPYVFNALQLSRGQVYLSDIAINHEEGAHSGLKKPSVRRAVVIADHAARAARDHGRDRDGERDGARGGEQREVEAGWLHG